MVPKPEERYSYRFPTNGNPDALNGVHIFERVLSNKHLNAAKEDTLSKVFYSMSILSKRKETYS